MAELQRKNLSRFSFFSGSTLAMAFSMLSVIVLLLWWQQLISRNLENQYRFFASQVGDKSSVSPGLRQLLQAQDAKLAAQILPDMNSDRAVPGAAKIIAERLENRQKMVLYERTFFILLLLSGHIFFLYIYFRERGRRKQTEETILLATHELRQPLQSLSLALETLAPKAKGASLRAIDSGLRDIAKLGELIRYLAGAFAPEARKQATTRIDDFAAFFRTFIQHEFAPNQEGRIRIANLPATGRDIRLSAELLRFLLRNLLENALKYASGTVSLSATEKRGGVILHITNEGTPIAAADFRKIGRIFYRSTSPAVQNTTGFGLGLYLCGRIARKAGGELWIEHTPSGRTSISLSLRNA